MVCAYCGRRGHLPVDCKWPKKGNVKLSPREVVEIRKELLIREQLRDALTDYSDVALAEKYGVSSNTIRAIRLNDRWIDV